MKIRGTCRNCGREFLVRQVLESQGHCPWCGRPFQPDYTAVLAEGLQMAEGAGGALENALEKIAGMEPGLILDEDSILRDIREHLESIRASGSAEAP